MIVERSVRVGGAPREIGQGPGISRYALSFVTPSGKRIEWSNDGHLKPMILDYVRGSFYLVTKPASVLDYDRFGCPEPAYVFFKHQTSWERVRFEQIPEELSQANLVINSLKHYKSAVNRTLTVSDITWMNGTLDKKNRVIDLARRSPHGCGNSTITD